jgi:hypothetical protein
MTETPSDREIGVSREGYVATVEMRRLLHNFCEMSQRWFGPSAQRRHPTRSSGSSARHSLQYFKLTHYLCSPQQSAA